MSPQLLQRLRAQSATLQARWETLLRLEPVSGPLALPDALARLIPDSLGRVFEQLDEQMAKTLSLADIARDRLPACECGYNPFLAYYVAGERAFMEAVVLLQSGEPENRNESDLAEVIRAVRRLATDEIDTFCGICAHRGVASCRFPAPAAPSPQVGGVTRAENC